ncbi:high mobility group protein B1 [Trichinella spiralis]|uniref:high mobility group protein B1 n=1 Tax=Trichinella spiralis TaxID=6334 RepID=UPI0001EFDE6E|nr:high mobility group protein B1 [Trichinella spiralis]
MTKIPQQQLPYFPHIVRTLSGFGLFCHEIGRKVVGESYVLRKFELIRKLSAAWQQLSVEEKQNYRNRAAELRNGLETKTPVKTPTESADLPIEPPCKKRRSSTERPSVCPKSMKHWTLKDSSAQNARQSIRFAEQKEQLIKENAELPNKLNMVNRRLSLKLPKEKEDQLLIPKLTDALKQLPFPGKGYI